MAPSSNDSSDALLTELGGLGRRGRALALQSQRWGARFARPSAQEEAALRIQKVRRGQLGRRDAGSLVDVRGDSKFVLFFGCGPSVAGRLDSAGLQHFATLIGFVGDSRAWEQVCREWCLKQGWDTFAGPDRLQFEFWLDNFSLEELTTLCAQLTHLPVRRPSRWSNPQQESRYAKLWAGLLPSAADTLALLPLVREIRRRVKEVGLLPEATLPEPNVRRQSRRSLSARPAGGLSGERLPGNSRPRSARFRSATGREGRQWKAKSKEHWPKEEPKTLTLALQLDRKDKALLTSQKPAYVDATEAHELAQALPARSVELPPGWRPGWMTRSAEERTGDHYLVALDAGEGTDLGWSTRPTQDGQLQVLGLAADGLLASWSAQNPQNSIVAGDLVENVNGCHGSASKLLDKLKQGHRLNLRMQRARIPEHVFEILLEKRQGASLGLAVDVWSSPTALRVTGVTTDGLIAGWSEENPLEMVVPGDSIFEVNGEKGSGVQLSVLLQRPGTLRICLRRRLLDYRGLMGLASQGTGGVAAVSSTARATEPRDTSVGKLTFAVNVRSTDPKAADLGLMLVGAALEAPRPRLAGSDVEAAEGLTVASLVANGLLEDWNRRCPWCMVNSGDRIIGVGGVGATSYRGSRSKLEGELRTGGRQVELTIARGDAMLAEFEVVVDFTEGSAGTQLGISLDFSEPTRLVIFEIAAEGLIQDWNAQRPTEEVFVGDSIYAVNGASGSAVALLAALRRPAVRLRLLVRRYEVDRQKAWRNLLRACEATLLRVPQTPRAPRRGSQLVGGGPNDGLRDDGSAADDRAVQFSVKLERLARQRLGINLDLSRESPLVTGICLGGLFAGWNVKVVGLSGAVCPGDCIHSVNNVSYERKAMMLQELRTAGQLHIIFRRSPLVPIDYEVHLSREQNPNQGLGLDLDNSEHGHLLVGGIASSGLVSMWNSDSADLALVPGDRIMEVNGVVGDPAKMLAQLRHSQRLELHVQRSSAHRVARMLSNGHPSVITRSPRPSTQSRKSLVSRTDTRLLQIVNEEPLDMEGVKSLLLRRANPNHAKEDGVRPLHVAALRGESALCATLLEYGADVNACDASGQTPMFFAKTAKVAEVLWLKGASLIATNVHRQTALHVHAANGFEKTLMWLAKRCRPELVHAIDSFGAQWQFYARKAGMEEKDILDIRGTLYKRLA